MPLLGFVDREMETMQNAVTIFIDTLFINFLNRSKPQISLISKGNNKFLYKPSVGCFSMTKERYHRCLQQFGWTKLQGYNAEGRITPNNCVWYVPTDTSRRQKCMAENPLRLPEIRDRRGYDSKELTAAHWQQRDYYHLDCVSNYISHSSACKNRGNL